MFEYSVLVSQYIDEKRKPISDGYYFIRDNNCYIAKKKPNGIIIGLKELEDIIYEGFKNIIINFSKTNNNKDIYCVALYTSEHTDLLMYINNEESFDSTLERYIKKYPQYKESSKSKELKMSLGDFSYSFDCVDGLNGKSLDIMKSFNSINYFLNVHNELYDETINDYSFYFDGAVFDNALYSLIEKVLNRLKVEFVNLNKTREFLSYPSCANGYIDYYLLIKRNCDEKLFYEIFEEMKKADDDFNEYIKTLDGLSVKTLFEVLSKECIKNTNIFSNTIRNEYAAVRILEERLNVKESIEILKNLIIETSLDNVKEVDSKIFLIICILINQSCNYKIPIEEVKKIIYNLNYEDKEIKQIIHHLEVNQSTLI